MLMDLLVPVGVLGALGLLFGFGLAIAAKVFEVKTDERVPLVRAALPGANCGGCGFPGCDALASSIVKGEAAVNACPVGGAEVAVKIGEIMGETVGSNEPEVACVHCKGDCESAPNRADYYGIQDCREALIANGGTKGCRFGCLGLGTCIKTCQFGALSLGENGLPQVDIEKCTACGQCMDACPRHIIDLIPQDQLVHVDCRSQDKGKIAKANCENACIGCKACTKVCEVGAITVENNLASIRYEICRRCESCVEKCPTGAITLEDRIVIKENMIIEMEPEQDICEDNFGIDGAHDFDAVGILEEIAIAKGQAEEKVSETKADNEVEGKEEKETLDAEVKASAEKVVPAEAKVDTEVSEAPIEIKPAIEELTPEENKEKIELKISDLK